MVTLSWTAIKAAFVSGLLIATTVNAVGTLPGLPQKSAPLTWAYTSLPRGGATLGPWQQVGISGADTGNLSVATMTLSANLASWDGYSPIQTTTALKPLQLHVRLKLVKAVNRLRFYDVVFEKLTPTLYPKDVGVPERIRLVRSEDPRGPFCLFILDPTGKVTQSVIALEPASSMPGYAAPETDAFTLETPLSPQVLGQSMDYHLSLRGSIGSGKVTLRHDPNNGEIDAYGNLTTPTPQPVKEEEVNLVEKTDLPEGIAPLFRVFDITDSQKNKMQLVLARRASGPHRLVFLDKTGLVLLILPLRSL